MSDLYDIAKPIRDAALAETLRALSPDAVASTRDGGTLAAHLVAVLMAWGIERTGQTGGHIRDGELLAAIGYGLGLLAGNAGMIYRPMTRDGRALGAAESVLHLLNRVAATAMNLGIQIEQGTADVSLPITRRADGTLGAAPFDVMTMLGEQKR